MLDMKKLTVTTPSDREIRMARTFDAPRQMVFDAMSKAEFIKRWLTGPLGSTMTVCECDTRPGGTFRHVWRTAKGDEMTMTGVYREVVPPERIVRTESFAFGPQLMEQLGTLVLT